MFQTKSPLNLMHGTPPGVAILPEHGIALERVTATKRAAILALIRKRLGIRNRQPKKKED